MQFMGRSKRFLSDKAACFDLQLVELKEAEGTSLKESERLEKEIAEVQELKVMQKLAFVGFVSSPFPYQFSPR